MFVTPGSPFELGRRLSRDVAERLSRNWGLFLLSGLLLIVSGVLIFSIDWTVRSLAVFIGALFILEGLSLALTTGIDGRTSGANVVTGLLSTAAGVAIIVWPSPGLVAVAIFLGAWLIVVGTITIAGSLAARRVLPDWWLLLIAGLLEIPLGVLALIDPGATLAAIVTVSGIWAVVVGVARVIFAFELKNLPSKVAEAMGGTSANGAGKVEARHALSTSR